MLLCRVQEDEIKSVLISVHIVVGFYDKYWDDIMMDRVLVDTSGHIGNGIDRNNARLAVTIKFPPSMFDLAQEMGRCG